MVDCQSLAFGWPIYKPRPHSIMTSRYFLFCSWQTRVIISLAARVLCHLNVNRCCVWAFSEMTAVIFPGRMLWECRCTHSQHEGRNYGRILWDIIKSAWRLMLHNILCANLIFSVIFAIKGKRLCKSSAGGKVQKDFSSASLFHCFYFSALTSLHECLIYQCYTWVHCKPSRHQEFVNSYIVFVLKCGKVVVKNFILINMCYAN